MGAEGCLGREGTVMGVRTTDSEHIALYDSVTGIAFGEVFDNETDADDFCNYVIDGGCDPRQLSPDELAQIRSDFEEKKREIESVTRQ